jgi:PHD/YefM family antitoxin component YafN of YafNO toxin-antitoxin module
VSGTASDISEPHRKHGCAYIPRLDTAAVLHVYALVYAFGVAVPVVMSFREFRAGLAGVLDRVRRSPGTAIYVGSHRRAEAVLVSVEQYEALLETSERQHAVAAALASVRAEGLEPGADDLASFVQVAAGELTTEELRERVLSRYQPHMQR